MDEAMKSFKHKMDAHGNVVFEFEQVGFFDYIQGDFDLTDEVQSYNIWDGQTTLHIRR